MFYHVTFALSNPPQLLYICEYMSWFLPGLMRRSNDLPLLATVNVIC